MDLGGLWGGILEVFGRLGVSFGVSWGAFGFSDAGYDLGQDLRVYPGGRWEAVPLPYPCPGLPVY